eukprot:CAMPEP_0170588102 /NCGR_PEP_ID=MMETSP0224-20130122/10648_1 /TAXON_ID=285029 /ORGANISM="Togula jolla, Strain CCCM 725" /LENGTH=51 /DNA_ID=CAMNT_0010911791 /DNA_START=35 /DNA_END=187 /DNA_ORIENTATION=-
MHSNSEQGVPGQRRLTMLSIMVQYFACKMPIRNANLECLEPLAHFGVGWQM